MTAVESWSIQAGMVRVCGHCQRSYSGGLYCPDCGPEYRLVEACDPQARLLLDRKGWAGIRALYGARRAMLLAIAGLLLAPAVGALLLRRSLSFNMDVDKFVWIGFAATITCVVLGVMLSRGAKIARRTRKGFDLPE